MGPGPAQDRLRDCLSREPRLEGGDPMVAQFGVPASWARYGFLVMLGDEAEQAGWVSPHP